MDPITLALLFVLGGLALGGDASSSSSAPLTFAIVVRQADGRRITVNVSYLGGRWAWRVDGNGGSGSSDTPRAAMLDALAHVQPQSDAAIAVAAHQSGERVAWFEVHAFIGSGPWTLERGVAGDEGATTTSPQYLKRTPAVTAGIDWLLERVGR